jgi:hypothetical protein
MPFGRGIGLVGAVLAASLSGLGMLGVTGAQASVGLSAAPRWPAGATSDLNLVHRRTRFAMTQSNNWSGYNLGVLQTGATYNSVGAEWVVPRATAAVRNQAEYSATWTGIGGGCLNSDCSAGDETLIQAGTEQDVASNGRASYSSWYELVPAPSVDTPLAVAPGNVIAVSISHALPEYWTITIRNLSRRQAFSTTLPYTSDLSTAEWIEETPVVAGTSGAQVGPLPRLTPVEFLSATANGADPHLNPTEAVQLVSVNGTPLATPSAPNNAGDAFNDCAYARSCARPMPPKPRVAPRRR